MATKRGLRMANLMSTSRVLGTELSTSHALTHLIFSTAQWGRYCHDHQMGNLQLRGEITCSGSHS